MPKKQNYISPKILKTVFLIVVIFFLVVVVFNLWVRTSLEDTSGTVVVTTVVPKPDAEKTPAIKDSKVLRQRTEGTIKEYEEATGKEEGILLLQ